MDRMRKNRGWREVEGGRERRNDTGMIRRDARRKVKGYMDGWMEGGIKKRGRCS